MVRRVTPSQLQSMMREAQRKQKAAIDNYNREVRRHNDKVRQSINEINRDIDRYNRESRQNHQKQKAAIDSHNRAVRAHNAKVEANRRRVRQELTRLSNNVASPTYQTVRTASVRLNESYDAVQRHYGEFGNDREEFLAGELVARENANSLSLANALSGADDVADEGEQTETEIRDELLSISEDLDHRWKGALFALSPRNPDAARHFCTSAREIITIILDTKAPDAAVEQTVPNCAKTPQGKPTRRAKIEYLLSKSGLESEAMTNFVDQDMTNVVELFSVFNSATHGEAGKYSLSTLRALRVRVEGGIFFLTKIAA
ncbi:hypothetical protein [Brevundimonas sp.]|uniref:pPIWI-associating nuclease domain-containing protein n=1 Tax=Brevundimonas sp. TaxID=1871086 RepID=UPI00351618E6